MTTWRPIGGGPGPVFPEGPIVTTRTPMERIEGLLAQAFRTRVGSQHTYDEMMDATKALLAAIRLAVEAAEAQRAMTEDWSDADRDRCFAAAAAWAKWVEENK